MVEGLTFFIHITPLEFLSPAFLSFALFSFEGSDCLLNLVGVNGCEVPPVPIPNTEVKLIRVEDTWLATAWENRSMPAFNRIELLSLSDIFLNSSVGRACGC